MAEKKEKKGFFKEFGEFISRGNVLDMAVGIIIGGAFTAIVTALTDSVLRPIINWILALCIGSDGLEGALTFLKRVDDAVTGLPILEQSIYIDWGAFINAIINFLLIALILFLIVRTINRVRAKSEEYKKAIEKAKLEKEAAKLAEDAAENAKKQAIAAGESAGSVNSDAAPTSGSGK